MLNSSGRPNLHFCLMVTLEMREALLSGHEEGFLQQVPEPEQYYHPSKTRHQTLVHAQSRLLKLTMPDLHGSDRKHTARAFSAQWCSFRNIMIAFRSTVSSSNIYSIQSLVLECSWPSGSMSPLALIRMTVCRSVLCFGVLLFKVFSNSHTHVVFLFCFFNSELVSARGRRW